MIVTPRPTHNDHAVARVSASVTAPARDAVPRRAVLTGTGLRKRFGSTEALRGVDVAIGAGEIVAVMGPSGSGKSTLLHVLAGILPPDEGSVTFDGVEIERLGEAERSRLRRTRFGFVFQFGQLIPELPAIENIALPLLLDGRRRADAEALAAIARAMVMEPDIVFADEPTGSLDSLAGEQVMELLTEAASASGATVILVTHEPRVAAYAHREIVVRDGRVSGAEWA
jgi:putative ABC transport system ATP-binding protein